jgi:hypothetical protein
VIKTTDQQVWGPLQESMKRADDQVHTHAIDVLTISANLVERQANDTTVRSSLVRARSSGGPKA